MVNPFLPILLLGATAPQAGLPDGPAILSIDQARADAEAAHDGDALRRVLDDRFAATFDTGRVVLDRDAYIRRVGHAPRDPAAHADLSDRRLKVDGDAAVLFETQTVFVMGTGGIPVAATRRVAVTYIHRDTGWRAFALMSVVAPTIP